MWLICKGLKLESIKYPFNYKNWMKLDISPHLNRRFGLVGVDFEFVKEARKLLARFQLLHVSTDLKLEWDAGRE